MIEPAIRNFLKIYGYGMKYTKKPTFRSVFLCHLVKKLLSAVPTGIETAKRNYFANWR